MADIKPLDAAEALKKIQDAVDAGKKPAEAAPAHSFTTSTGVKVDMSPPKRATQLDIGSVLGASFSPYSFQVVKALMYVTHLGGNQVGRICTRANADAVMGKLGDAGVDEVVNAFLMHFQVEDGPSVIIRDAFARAVGEGHISQEQAEAALGGPLTGGSDLPL